MDALMIAAKKGDTKKAELLILNGHDVNHVIRAGWNALMIASYYGHDKVIEILIHNGTNVNAVQPDGWNALMLAALNGHEKVIKLLIKFGSDVHAVDNEGTNALMIAAINGHKHIIELLIQSGCDVNTVDNNRANAIILSSKNGTESTIEVLTACGSNVLAVDSDNKSALMYASYNGDVKSVEMLIRCGCNIDAIDNSGRNALMMACDNKHEKVIEQFIKSYTFFEFDFDVTNLLFNCNDIIIRNNQYNKEITVNLLLKIAEYDPLKLITNESLMETLSELERNDKLTFRKKISCILWRVKDKSSVYFDHSAEKYLSPYIPSKWRKDKKIVGQGASGSVYELDSKDRVTDLRLAVKEIYFKDTKISNHLKEVNIMLKLQHKRIIECFGFEIKDNSLYIFLEYMPIGSLTDYIESTGPLEEGQVLLYTKQLFEGVSYLHNFNPQIIHRDIKGGNILMKDENNIKLADFGISKILEATCPRTVTGTTKFMAPEVILADNDTAYTIKADIWSVGCTIVEMVTGKPPFSGYPEQKVLLCHIQNQGPVYELPISTSKTLRELLDQTFHLNPTERPTSDELLQRFFFK